MDKYLTLAGFLGMENRRFDSVLELIIRGDEILSATGDLVNGIVDRGFLNPGEAGYYYGLGKTASQLYASIYNLFQKVYYNSDEFYRISTNYALPLSPNNYFQSVGEILSSGSGESTGITFRTGIKGAIETPFRNLFLRSGDPKSDTSFTKAPCSIITSVDVRRFKDLGWVSQGVLDAIYAKANKSSGSTEAYTYLVTNLDIPSFLCSIINTSVIGKGGIESQTQYIPAGYPMKMQTASVALFQSKEVSTINGPTTVDRSDLFVSSYAARRHNSALVFGFADLSRNGTAVFNLSDVFEMDVSDVWLTAYILRGYLAPTAEMYCATRLAKFLRAMDADFVQTGFTDSTDRSQIKNWCYNYICMNLPGTPLRDQILKGETYLPIADGLADL